MRFYWLLLGVLAVWRVTHLLNAEDGPWQFVVRLRQAAGIGFWGEVLDCFYCLSLWIAAPAAILLGSGIEERTFLWLALSAGAILLERLTLERQAESNIDLITQENQHVLRQQPAEYRQEHDATPQDAGAERLTRIGGE